MAPSGNKVITVLTAATRSCWQPPAPVGPIRERLRKRRRAAAVGRRGAVAVGDDGAAAVGRRGAVVVGEEGAAAVGRHGGVVVGERYESHEGWRTAAAVGTGIAIGTMLSRPPLRQQPWSSAARVTCTAAALTTRG